MTSPHQTINREFAIDLFHHLMEPNSSFRFLRLLGDAKQGKSHLVTKIFPALAREVNQARCAVLDLRNRAQTIPDVLHAACGLLGPQALFPTYYTTYQEWTNRSKVTVTGLQALLSLVQIKSEGEEAEGQKIYRHLTAQFVADLRNLTDLPLILFFDHLDNATEITRNWLMSILLVQLVPLTHLRVVVAGRAVPEAYGSYASICRSYELQPVREVEAYITYCRQNGATLEDQSIQDFVRAFDYKPGLFVDYVRPTFIRRETSYD